MKPIILTEDHWLLLQKELENDYARSVIRVSYKLKQNLGFTVRRHRIPGLGYEITQIHLDFYDDIKRTYFLLKYSEFLHNAAINN